MTAFVWTILTMLVIDVASNLDSLRRGDSEFIPAALALWTAMEIPLIVWASILLWEAHK